ncbi:MAG: TonB-dependent receptor plug domain-containing protein [Deltaproteobacteria bacterium]|nr:TonB-dependent receptor plug domain-containing protein [Deltaproteobacteria bacterium]
MLESDEELEEELKYLKAETYVITASKIMEEIKKAPASISVITAKQIREMGARDLTDVLYTVTGYDYVYSTFGTRYAEARRNTWFLGSMYLFMINSHPMNENYLGGADFDTMALDNIKRIEFIRGPGSALYGANAFSGVINIITKETEDIDGLELTARGGSYNTQQYNVLFGKDFNGLETVFNFNY